jgi:GNAT superfamily N-acetyltransferase
VPATARAAPRAEETNVEYTVRAYSPGDGPAFRELNEAWITQHFALEDADRRQLADPEASILRPGGAIVVAELHGDVVGCCALVPHGEGTFEVAKMVVATRARGLGLGRRLLEAAIAEARSRGARRLYLESNDRLDAALRLYESVGFRHLPQEQRPASPYGRCNVWMEREV